MVKISNFIGGKMLPIPDFADWAEAWANRGAVLAAKQPEIVKDHFAYFLLLAAQPASKLKEASKELVGWNMMLHSASMLPKHLQ